MSTTNLPKHNNSKYANKTLYWSGSDKLTQWQHHMTDPKYFQFFKENNWEQPEAITYQYNSHGFRCAEFNDTPSYLALGCSFTEGVGLAIEQSWPALLAQQLNQPVINLGVGASSLDTCFRLLDYYIDKLNILGVFVLEPPPDRFELFESGAPYGYCPQLHYTPHQELIYKQWILSDNNSYYNIKKNKYAMQCICNNNNIKLVSLPFTALCIKVDFISGYARDLMHPGPSSHIRVTDNFLLEFNKLNLIS